MAEKVFAEVHYKKIENNKIMITEFKNFMGSDDIRKKYGDMVYEIYSNHIPNMVINESGTEVEINVDRYSVGRVLYKSSFSYLISEMKSCGKALNRAIKLAADIKPEDIKSVTI